MKTLKKIMSVIVSIFLIGLIIYIFGVIAGTASMIIGWNETFTWHDVFISPLECIKIISVLLTAMGLCIGIFVAVVFIGAAIKTN